MPANGLLYLTLHSCACNLKTKLAGFFALSSDRTPTAATAIGPRHEKGPAFGPGEAYRRPPASGPSSDWPAYRHDSKRSGMTASRLPGRLAPAWTTDLGGKLSSVTVAAASGRIYIATIDGKVLCLAGR